MTDDLKPKPDRTWWIIGGVFAAFWLFYIYFLGPRTPRFLEGTGVERPAEYNWTLRDLDDEPVTFARFKGKTVFLNVWATWCPPCVGEMPSIARLADQPRLKGKNIEFVCVSTDESSETVRRFLKDKSWTMTMLRATELPPVFLTEGIPATFIISHDGRVVASEVGAAQWDDPAVTAFLEKTADRPPAPQTTEPRPAANSG